MRRPGGRTAGPAFLAGLMVLGTAGRSAAKVSDARLYFKPVEPQRVAVRGELAARLALTAGHLQRLPKTYLLAPFQRRTGLPSNGQMMAQWLEFMSAYAASQSDEDLQRQVEECATALLALQRPDGFIGLDPEEMWDGWVANRLVSALLAAAENSGQIGCRSAAVRLARNLADRFPPSAGTAEQAVVGRCVLEGLCRAYDYSREYSLIGAARNMPKRDVTGLLDFLAENRRLGYRHPPPWHGNKAYEVLTYLNGVCAYFQVSAAQQSRPLEDAWDDIDRRHRYVTGGVPAVFDWRQGTTPDDSDDAAGTAEWLLYNLNLFYSTGQVRYIEMVERILFNHLPFAQTVDGQFTANNDLHGRQGHPDLAATGEGARALIHVLGAICSTRRRDAFVNLYLPSTVRLRLQHGVEVTLTQETALPAAGTVRLAVQPSLPSQFDLCLRIPSWSAGHRLSVNDQPVSGKVEKGYVAISRTWQAGDRVVLDLSIEPWVQRRSGSAAGTHQVALCLGPMVMCVDSHYNTGLHGPFRFVARRGREAQLFTTVSPVSAGKPVGPFAPPVAAVGQAFSAGRKTIVYLTPLAYCVRRPGAWWRVWQTVYEPSGAIP